MNQQVSPKKDRSEQEICRGVSKAWRGMVLVDLSLVLNKSI